MPCYKEVRISIPFAAAKRVREIIEIHGIFEDEEDFILHAVTDLLEKYKEVR